MKQTKWIGGGVAYWLVAWGLLGCSAREFHQTIEPQSRQQVAFGARLPVSVGKFENTSPYLNALFSDGEDRLGNQARTILKTHLSQSGRLLLLDRENLTELGQEAELNGEKQELLGAALVFTGQVTEFGRKTVGDEQLWGILGRGKQQIAYAKVSLSAVDARSGEVLFTTQGAAECGLSEREVLGFGSTAGYDSTLNGKVLDLSISQAVDEMLAGLEAGELEPAGGA